jgi:hypothetical protein
MHTVELESMAIEMPEVDGHPNREPFRGVLTLIDVASDRAPSGARGHRVVLTRTAAEAALPSLLGMALDYAPALDRHDVRRKVGVITRAEIVGRHLELGGYLFAKDFPEIVKELGRAGRRGARGIAGTLAASQLGMSYEIADARVADVNAKVWAVEEVRISPVLARNLPTPSTGPRRRVEFLVPASGLAAALSGHDFANAVQLMETSLGIVHQGELFHIEGFTTEYFGGTAYLYRVVGVE